MAHSTSNYQTKFQHQHEAKGFQVRSKGNTKTDGSFNPTEDSRTKFKQIGNKTKYIRGETII